MLEAKQRTLDVRYVISSVFFTSITIIGFIVFWFLLEGTRYYVNEHPVLGSVKYIESIGKLGCGLFILVFAALCRLDIFFRRSFKFAPDISMLVTILVILLNQFGTWHLPSAQAVIDSLIDTGTTGFYEEALFRGLFLAVLYKAVQQKTYTIPVLISSLIFAALHIFAQPLDEFLPNTIFRTSIALALAAVMIRSGSIYPAMFLHALNNFLGVFSPVLTIDINLIRLGYIALGFWAFILVVLEPHRKTLVGWRNLIQ